MICERCGGTVKDNDPFCPQCGAPTNVQFYGDDTTKKKKKKRLLISLAILCVIAGAIAITCAVIKNRKKTLDVTDYITVSYSGRDGYATANVEFDRLRFDRDVLLYGKFEMIGNMSSIQKRIEANKSDSAWDVILDCLDDGMISYKTEERLEDAVDALEDAWEYELNESDNLSNGDTLIITVNVNNAIAERYGFEFKGGNIKETVNGLEEVEVVDLFDYVTVEFSGVSPYVSASVNEESNDYSYSFSVSLDKYDNIKKGDTVVATLDVNDAAMLNSYGCVVKEKTKEFVCEDVNSYISSMDEIPEEQMNSMKKQAEDTFYAMVASDWDEEEQCNGFTYIGSYFLVKKNMSYYGPDNAIYLIYKVDVTNPDSEPFSYYTYTKFSDLITTADGVCSVDLSEYEVPEYNWLFHEDGFDKGRYVYDGYETIDALYRECVTCNLEGYEYTADGEIVP